MFLYATADKIGQESGGGLVTAQELQALKQFARGEQVVVLGKDDIVGGSDPWGWDQVLLDTLKKLKPFKLAHFYSGSFTSSVKYLKENGCKVTYTCAAHRVADSKKAHEDIGLPYNLPHLTDPSLWEKYSGGYWSSDVLIVPSKHSEEVVKEQMDALKMFTRPKVKVVPHGCHVPKIGIKPRPSQFVVGYLGSVGADKSLKTLLLAWKKLKYKNSLLKLAGKESTSDFAYALINAFGGGGSIVCCGWQTNISDFYNSITAYVQPSATEGFGIEVLEAMAHGRIALCSDHAGAKDVVHSSCVFQANNPDALADKIEEMKTTWDLDARAVIAKETAQNYEWSKIREKYIRVWEKLF
ncbi:glycosyltransferase family 1 protein [Candidatus Parcubacteria bacterium]|nr:MAG: glycosyltransferase family 1 protein [Candidatus Parcubacteria bacterium]